MSDDSARKLLDAEIDADLAEAQAADDAIESWDDQLPDHWTMPLAEVRAIALRKARRRGIAAARASEILAAQRRGIESLDIDELRYYIDALSEGLSHDDAMTAARAQAGAR